MKYGLIKEKLFSDLKRYTTLWFTRRSFAAFGVMCAIFLIFFWGCLSSPRARIQDMVVDHLVIMPLCALIASVGVCKGCRRLFFYPLLLVIVAAAEMLNFDFVSQYSVERTLRYGSTLMILMLLADIGISLLGSALKKSVISAVIIVLMQLSAVLLFTGIIIRNVFGDKKLEIDSVSAVFQTDLTEALLFVAENPSLAVGGILILISGIVCGIWYSRTKWFSAPGGWMLRLVMIIIGISLCLISSLSISSLVRKGKLSTFALLVKGNRFRAELARFNRDAEARKLVPLDDSEKSLVKSRGKDGRFILIIGESNSRDYMSCYGYGKSTTPFLDRMKTDERFTFFTNVYSNHVHTNEALKYLFSELNQYNPERKFKVTLFDVLRHCSYYSVFISNQYFYDSARSAVSAIAQAADERIYLNDEMDFIMKRNRFDMETVEALKKHKSRSREVVVIHLMSCHAPYQIRYPAGFRSDLSGDYERATAYMDSVLQGIFEYAMADESVNGVIFIPDHGEDVVLGDHDSAGFTIDMTRIPMICYFRPDYTAREPELFRQLKKSADKVFTNDLAFDFILDTMGIKTGFNRDELHVLSDQYRIDFESGRTLHGRGKLDGTILK